MLFKILKFVRVWISFGGKKKKKKKLNLEIR